MSSSRPGLVPLGVTVKAPSWPNLLPTAPARAVQPEQLSSAGKSAPSLGHDEVLQHAHMKAAEILQQAAADADAAVEAARKEGYAAGVASGLEQAEAKRLQAERALESARAEADSLRRAAEADARAMRAEAEVERQSLLARVREEATGLLEQARVEQRELLDAAQAAVVDLAVTAAMRLVQGHLAVQPAAVVAMVGAGLRRLKDSHCMVRLSPQDLPLLHAQRAVLERELGSGSLKLQPDGSLQQGGFLIHSPNGVIDATEEQRSASLRSALNVALGGD